MYEFTELEALAKIAAQIRVNIWEICAAIFGEDAPNKKICEGAMSLYNETLKAFADGLQGYFDRAYEDWKEKRGDAE